jgi:hypothetical protein
VASFVRTPGVCDLGPSFPAFLRPARQVEALFCRPRYPGTLPSMRGGRAISSAGSPRASAAPNAATRQAVRRLPKIDGNNRGHCQIPPRAAIIYTTFSRSTSCTGCDDLRSLPDCRGTTYLTQLAGQADCHWWQHQAHASRELSQVGGKFGLARLHVHQRSTAERHAAILVDEESSLGVKPHKSRSVA